MSHPDTNPHDTVLTLAQAAKAFGRLSGRTPHVATVYRWATKGVRGVTLETVRLGGLRLVRAQSLEEFLARINTGESGTTAGSQALLDPAVQQRRRAEIDAARRRLDSRCQSSRPAHRPGSRGGAWKSDAG
jgi:hypothetical protein